MKILVTGTEDYPGSLYLENNDFESGLSSQWKIDDSIESATSPYANIKGNNPPLFNSPQIVSTPTIEQEQSNSSLKFSISSEKKYDWVSQDGTTQKVRVYRSEIVQPPVEMNSEYIYRFRNLILETDEADYLNHTIIAQWHEVPDFSEGETWRNPPLSLITKNNKFYLSNKWTSKRVSTNQEHDGELFDLGNYEEDLWYEWDIHVKWSYQEDGFLEIWKNNELVVSKVGPNTYNDAIGPYFKTGIYQPGGWKNRQATLKELLLDDVEIVKIEGGDRSLIGDGQDNIYILSRQSAAGSQITDTGGVDTLNLSDLTLSFSDFKRSGNNLIVNIDRDAEFDEASDLTIVNFWSSSDIGEGYIETLDNINGIDIFNSLLKNTEVIERAALRLEAEDFQLQNYAIEEGDFASGDRLISLRRSPENVGIASNTIDELSGAYDIVIGYFDENDGIAEIQVQLNDNVVGSVLLERELGGGIANDITFQEATIRNVTLNPGDLLTVRGILDNTEFARIDYLDFLPVSSPLTDDLVNSGDV
ncbi:MAG: heparin lyase I family protein [Xenococcaceae cyanobacterium MO_188.B32]|nr:heparin lyase I family protein [Xenococcaceae cyanobacterium MO_188.B32]